MLPAFAHLKSIKNSVDLADKIYGNSSIAAIASNRDAQILEGVLHRNMASGLEPIVQSRCNGGNEDRCSNDYDIVDIDRD
jgi:hypothetical protein